jgi:hypothetical protein
LFPAVSVFSKKMSVVFFIIKKKNAHKTITFLTFLDTILILFFSCAAAWWLIFALSLLLGCNAAAVHNAVETLSVDQVWEGGTNSPTSVISKTLFTGLDTSLYTYTLTMKVFETDFDAIDEYVDDIFAGSTTLSSYCNPGIQEGTQYYTCVAGQDVSATAVPTALPTVSSTVDEQWEGGTNSPTSGVSHSFTGLDTSHYTYTLNSTDFASSNEHVDKISAGSTTLSSKCNPGVDNGGVFYTCVAGRDVSTRAH